MRRLVYSPKAFVYILTDDGKEVKRHNLSDLVVSGNISRKVNQVSTAEVTFQNPGRRFTKPGNPTFRPMDRIQIYLQRLPQLPVQVFTGYLDEAPYYQMYPGTCTVRASCTLKRLQYSFFDPGLPFMLSFLGRYGWYSSGNGDLQNTSAARDRNTDEPQTLDHAQSASMSELMFASLKHIGGIDPGQIIIEELPENLVSKIARIFYMRDKEAEDNMKALNEWLKAYIGEGALGTGGMAAVGVPGDLSGFDDKASLTLADLVALSLKAGLRGEAAAISASVAMAESTGNPKAINGVPCVGLWQINASVHHNFSVEELKIPSNNAKEMLRISSNGTNWNPWTTYTGADTPNHEKTYLRHLDQAKQLVESTPATTSDDTTTSETAPESGGNTSGRTHIATLSDPPETVKAAKGDRKSNGRAPETSDTGTTRFDAIVARANKMHELVVKNGLQYNPARPGSDTTGYDCSSSVASLIHAAGYPVDVNACTGPLRASCQGTMVPGRDPTGRFTIWNNDDGGACGMSVHVFAEIEGRWWTTADHKAGHFVDDYHGAPFDGFEPFHMTGLDEPADVPADADLSVGSGADPDAFSQGSALAAAKAASVTTFLNFPQAVSSAESQALTGDRSLMNDQPLLPFIDQLAKGSLRSFQSLPNGDFFAWHPDYFGVMDTAPYWEIDDIEVISGDIQLSDDALVTHAYVIGAVDPSQRVNPIVPKLGTRGVVTILNMGSSDFLNLETKKDKKTGEEEQLDPFLGDFSATMKFLQRYGPRPYVEENVFIRSHIFETFAAYQAFMLAWARQFLTTFTFTFMPELYPGGIVEFKDHGIRMYIDEVHHSWDYGTAFTTQANLSAPHASPGSDKTGISRGMVKEL